MDVIDLKAEVTCLIADNPIESVEDTEVPALTELVVDVPRTDTSARSGTGSTQGVTASSPDTGTWSHLISFFC